MYVIDTNILIDASADQPAVADFLDREIRAGTILYLPTIVALEFLGFPKLTAQDRTLFNVWLRTFRIVDLTLDVVEQAAICRREYGLKLADAVIAASAIIMEATLLTRNVADFRKITGLQIVNPWTDATTVDL